MEALKFREMPYERPDGDALKLHAHSDGKSCAPRGSYGCGEGRVSKRKRSPNTSRRRRSRRCATIDTRDKFYDEENGFGQLSRNWRSIRRNGRRRCFVSAVLRDFEKEYGTLIPSTPIVSNVLAREIIRSCRRKTIYDRIR